LDGEVKEPNGGTYSDPSDLAMDPVLNLDNLDFTPIIGTQSYDSDTVFAGDTRVFLQVVSKDSHSKIISTANLNLDGDLVLDFSQLDESTLSSGDRLDLIVADALSGSFDSATFVGLSSATASLSAVDTDSDTTADTLRLEFSI